MLRGVPKGAEMQARRDLEALDDENFIIRTYGDSVDIASDLSQAELCLMPSIVEPFGLTGLEAISAAVLPVMQANSGLGEYLNKNVDRELVSSVIVPAATSGSREDSWTDALIRLLGSPGRIRQQAQQIREALLEIPSSANHLRTHFFESRSEDIT